MSGTYAIPFLLAHPDSLTSYVPIAPVGTGDFRQQQYEELKVLPSSRERLRVANQLLFSFYRLQLLFYTAKETPV